MCPGRRPDDDEETPEVERQLEEMRRIMATRRMQALTERRRRRRQRNQLHLQLPVFVCIAATGVFGNISGTSTVVLVTILLAEIFRRVILSRDTNAIRGQNLTGYLMAIIQSITPNPGRRTGDNDARMILTFLVGSALMLSLGRFIVYLL